MEKIVSSIGSVVLWLQSHLPFTPLEPRRTAFWYHERGKIAPEWMPLPLQEFLTIADVVVDFLLCNRWIDAWTFSYLVNWLSVFHNVIFFFPFYLGFHLLFGLYGWLHWMSYAPHYYRRERQYLKTIVYNSFFLFFLVLVYVPWGLYIFFSVVVPAIFLIFKDHYIISFSSLFFFYCFIFFIAFFYWLIFSSVGWSGFYDGGVQMDQPSWRTRRDFNFILKGDGWRKHFFPFLRGFTPFGFFRKFILNSPHLFSFFSKSAFFFHNLVYQIRLPFWNNFRLHLLLFVFFALYNLFVTIFYLFFFLPSIPFVHGILKLEWWYDFWSPVDAYNRYMNIYNYYYKQPKYLDYRRKIFRGKRRLRWLPSGAIQQGEILNRHKRHASFRTFPLWERIHTFWRSPEIVEWRGMISRRKSRRIKFVRFIRAGEGYPYVRRIRMVDIRPHMFKVRGLRPDYPIHRKEDPFRFYFIWRLGFILSAPVLLFQARILFKLRFYWENSTSSRWWLEPLEQFQWKLDKEEVQATNVSAAILFLIHFFFLLTSF